MIGLRVRIVVCILGVLVTAGGVSYFTSVANQPAQSFGLQPVAPKTESTNMFKPTMLGDLNNIISINSELEIAVSVVDLEYGSRYNAGESGIDFRAASITKLITASTYLHEVEQGNVTLEQRIGGTSANELIKQMLMVSDNTAWHTITDYLGSRQDTFAQSIGLSSFSFTPLNTLRADDAAKLLTLLYQNKLLNSDHTDLVLNYMEKADGADLVKAALPSEAKTYHKYGMLFGNLHDAAIVTYKGQNFALVIFTKNPDDTTNDYNERAKLIHEITQTVLSNLVI